MASLSTMLRRQPKVVMAWPHQGALMGLVAVSWSPWALGVNVILMM